MKREYRDYVSDILDAIRKIREFTRGLDLEGFHRDEKTTFAVIRALEIIGEAVKKIPETIKRRHNDIPWGKISAMRDKLIHEYFGVNKEVVWRTAKEDIEPLERAIQAMLKNIDGTKGSDLH